MKDFLSETDRRDLRARHRQERDRRVADRIKAVLLRDKGWSFGAIAEALLLDEETIRLHLKDYLKEEKLKPANGGSKGKLSPMQVKGLKHHLTKRTYTKVSEICTYVFETYGVRYSVAGLTQWLHAHGFTYKKPKGTPAKADPGKQAAFVGFYKDLQQKTPPEEPILFGDGVHPTMATKITYGWIRRGKDKLIATIASRSRLNVMGTLDLEKMNLITTRHDRLNSSAMEVHFRKIREAYPRAPNIHLILDCGPYNMSIQTREAAKKLGITLHHLPPYSPNLNPIERVWKVMNEQVRNNRVFRSASEFRTSILTFFSNTWPRIAHTMRERINDQFQILKPVPSC